MGTEVERIIAAALARHSPDGQPGALCAVGDELVASAQMDQALACFDHALRIDGECAHAWFGRSTVLTARGRTREAAGCLRRALDADPRFVPALVCKGHALRSQGLHAEAIRCYDAALAEHPDREDVSVVRAATLQDLLRTEEVRQKRASAQPGRLSSHPPTKSVRPDGTVDRTSEKVEAAPVRRTSAPSAMPSSVPPRRTSAMPSSVPPIRTSAPRQVPSTAPARRSSVPGELNAAPATMGAGDVAELDDVRVLCLASRCADALRKLDPLAARHPTSLEVWTLRAHILLSLNDFDASLASVERATSLDARNVGAWKLTAKILLAMKRDVRAVAIAERVLTLAPRDPHAHRLHADCLVAAKRHADAVFAYEKVIQYVPGDAAAWLALGRALGQIHRLPEARMALSRALSIAEGTVPELALEAKDLLAQLSGR